MANYNKFEFRNPYRIRLEDFVNETVIERVVRGLGQTCSQSRDDYVALLEDVNEGWSLSSALNYIGLGILAPAKASALTVHVDDAKDFAALYVACHGGDCRGNSNELADLSLVQLSFSVHTILPVPINSSVSTWFLAHLKRKIKRARSVPFYP